MRKDVFALIDPGSIIGDNVQNYHVFQAVYETSTKEYVSMEQDSCCGKMTRKKNPKVYNLGVKKDAITKLAELQRDEEAEICGQCVATFYAAE